MNSNLSPSMSSKSTLSSSPTLTTEEHHIQCFRKHCKIYYQKSLSISSSSTHSTSNSQNNDNNHGNDIEQQQKEDNDDNRMFDYEASKTVLNAFEFHFLSHDANSDADHMDFLNSDSVKQYKHALQRCNLYIDNDTTNNNHNNNNIKMDNKKNSFITYNQTNEKRQLLLMEYMNIMNEERRIAHLLKMKERQLFCQQILQEKISTVHNMHKKITPSLSLSPLPSTSTSFLLHEYNVTTITFLSHIRTTIQNFVTKYKQNIGSHSFLNGIRNIIQKQICNEKVWIWKLDIGIITESCQNKNYASVKGSGDGSFNDGETYIKDAVSLLTSFMLCYHPTLLQLDEENNCNKTTNASTTITIATHSGEEKKEEEENVKMKTLLLFDDDDDDDNYYIQFYIHPGISDVFLKRFLNDIPYNLDAKPTGTCFQESDDDKEKKNVEECGGSASNHRLVRFNARGEADESMSIYTSIEYWTNSFCDIL